ncbi:E3 ubiquitin-protein ligase RHA2B-like [Mangifera indica]|uniref:E3 ubiquitin-protein ligase RHA2B-like n=1 Tax=Mangifera indica TaxID=29780 RepID=UPI001CFA5028|nr:E3 ubiquitin-protein ligase RHA2B-like [Mangifera indica]
MAALSEFFSHLYTMTIVFFTLLVIETLVLLRSATATVCKTKKRFVTTTQYLKLIEELNPTTSYHKNHHQLIDEATPAVECLVCLSDFEDGDKVRKLNCNHTFHKDCLDKWLQQYLATCPLCRTKVLPDEVVADFHGQLQNQNQMEFDGSDEEMVFLLSALHGNILYRFF